jgi:hypothetical protein
MEAAGSSEMLLIFYKTIGHHIPEKSTPVIKGTIESPNLWA